MPVGVDWLVFYPAVRAFLLGANPYLVGEGFHKVYEPFWTYIILAPLVLFPYAVSRFLLFFVSLVAFGYTAIRLGASRAQLLLFLFSWPVMGCLMTGNVDWLVLGGLWMPPRLGLFFVLMKPQIGLPVALYWAWDAWRRGGARELVRIFLPVTAAFALSFALYGFWFRQVAGMDANPERITGWPWVVPLGLYVLFYSLRDRDHQLARVPGPLLFPYASQFNYATVLAGLFSRPRIFMVAWLLLWSIVGIRFLM